MTRAAHEQFVIDYPNFTKMISATLRLRNLGF